MAPFRFLAEFQVRPNLKLMNAVEPKAFSRRPSVCGRVQGSGVGEGNRMTESPSEDSLIINLSHNGSSEFLTENGLRVEALV